MSERKAVLFIVPYPMHRAPSQRFRVEQFLPLLEQEGVIYRVLPFLDDHTYSVLYDNSSAFGKTVGVLKGFVKRIISLVQLRHYDYIFIHREASPLGPPFFEFFAAKVLRKKLIYDFDDAIWIPDSTNKLLNWLKAFWKVRKTCKWSHKVVAGNEYLFNYASRFNKNVFLIPTCVDTEHQHNRLKDQNETPLTIGWTGSHSTLKYLHPLVPLLKSLTERMDVRVLIICNKRPEFSFKGLEFIQWNEENEIEDLLKMNVGIMPLFADAWSEGKCGFKLIQYLALGIPAIASPIGVNATIIGESNAQFLCTTEQEWRHGILALLENVGLRSEIGKKGRERIIVAYSIEAYADKFLTLFKE